VDGWQFRAEQQRLADERLAGIPVLLMTGEEDAADHAEKLQAASIGGVAATFDTISNGSYPVARPLFMYVKKAHIGVIPGIAEYLTEFTSPKAWGPEGYLASKGMIPLSDSERGQVKQAATDLTPMKL